MHTSENRTTEIRRCQGPGVIFTNHHTHNLILIEFPSHGFLDILPLNLNSNSNSPATFKGSKKFQKVLKGKQTNKQTLFSNQLF